MGEHVGFKKITIERLVPPPVAHFKNAKTNEPYDVEYNFLLTIDYPGQSYIPKLETLEDCLDVIREHQTVYQPSVEEVTMNGMFGCD